MLVFKELEMNSKDIVAAVADVCFSLVVGDDDDAVYWNGTILKLN